MIRYISESVLKLRYNLRNFSSTTFLRAETTAPSATVTHYNHLTIFDRTIGFAFQTESANFSHMNKSACITIVMNPVIGISIFSGFYHKTPPFKGVNPKSLQFYALKGLLLAISIFEYSSASHNVRYATIRGSPN